jgi:CheY-like chemotaxis protein
MIPVLDGPGLLRAVAANEDLRHIPVAMMSSLPETRAAVAVVAFLRIAR